MRIQTTMRHSSVVERSIASRTRRGSIVEGGLAGTWLAQGNRVEVLLNGDGTYPRLWQDLRSAKQSITLQLYYGAPGRMADTLGQILIQLSMLHLAQNRSHVRGIVIDSRV